MGTFKAGDTIQHPVHGNGTITFVGDERIGIEFGNGQHALFKTDALIAELAAGQQAPDPAPSPATPREWPDDTFFADDEPGRRSMGTHWRPFVEDPADLMAKLPELMPKMELFRGYGDFFPSPRALPEAWPTGFAMSWPDVHHGLMLVCRIESDANNVVSLFPWLERGIETQVRLKQVRVWEGELEAQIHVEWGEAEIAFFDVAFAANRGWYRAGEDYAFILLGIAYDAKPSEVLSIPFNPPADQLAWQAIIDQREDKQTVPMPTELTMAGMAMFLPIREWDHDDYEFRGPVVEVSEVIDVLGEPAWRLRVTVMRFGDEDADLAILVTRRSWKGDAAPAVGMDIEGTLWLQGRLWMPANKGAPAKKKPPVEPVPSSNATQEQPKPSADTLRHFDTISATLGVVLDALRAAETQTVPDLHSVGFRQNVQILLARYRSSVEDVIALLGGSLAQVAADPNSTDLRVRRVGERLITALRGLQGLAGMARSMAATGVEVEARDLLVGAFEYTLAEVVARIEALREALVEPLEALRRRGLPTDGDVELPFSFTLSAAPQLQALVEWMRRPESVSVQREREPVPKGSGLLARLLNRFGG